MSHNDPRSQAWATEFGDAYHGRNVEYDPAKLTTFFSWALQSVPTRSVQSVLEFGAGDGRNLLAIDALRDIERLHGVEVNPGAFEKLRRRVHGGAHVCASILDPDITFPAADLVLTKGLLIHIDPYARASGCRLTDLERAIDVLVSSARKYLLVCEYYAPRAESVPYQGNSPRTGRDLCWRNDFAGLILGAWQDFKLVDYGFVYHDDERFAEDDVTWFLLRRTP